ncbi:MAG: hypothetical protein Q4F41_02010 [Eubacteriales bacterium]|nr:hypothetical protein [Eubacteriales bacterium]
MVTMKNKSYEKQVKSLVEEIQEAGAVVVGAASGMSAAAGYRHYYESEPAMACSLPRVAILLRTARASAA